MLHDEEKRVPKVANFQYVVQQLFFSVSSRQQVQID